MKLGIAAIFKNEKPYIIEWLAYHRLIGFEKFYIADNMSDDGSSELLEELDKAGIITRIVYPTRDNKPPQLPAYNYILKKYRNSVDFLAYIDADEFVFPDKGVSLKETLEPLFKDDAIGAVALNWAIFGSSGNVKYSKEPVIERFINRSRQTTRTNRHIKTIVKPDFCEYFENPHKVVLKKGNYVKVTGDRFNFHPDNIHGTSETTDWSPVRINHYVVKSFEEFKNKKQKRGRATVNELRRDGFFKAHDMNHEFDDSMSHYYDAVRNEARHINYKISLSKFYRSTDSVLKFIGNIIFNAGEAGRWIDKKMHFSLLPYSGVEKSDKYDWQSIDNDPGFILKRYGAMPKGWYLLTVKLTSSLPRLNGKLYMNYGDGMTEEDSIQFPLKSGSLLKKVCYFQKTPSSIRFDPANEKVEFSIETLKLSKLTKGYAQRMMNKKVESAFGIKGDNLPIQALVSKYEMSFLRNQEKISYKNWLKIHRSKCFSKEQISQKQENLKETDIKISLIITSAIHDADYATSFMESLTRQSHTNFEVIFISHFFSELVRDEIEKYVIDKGINYKWVAIADEKNDVGDIRKAVMQCTGDYVAFMNGNYILNEHALLFLSNAVVENRGVRVLYTDEDVISGGTHNSPLLKPSWSPDLFYSQDYISGFVAIKRFYLERYSSSLCVDKGHEVFSFLLDRASELQSKDVIRLPYILAHNLNNRHFFDSTSRYKVIKRHFSHVNDKIKVETALNGAYRVKWPLPEVKPKVSLLIPTRDGYSLLKTCISSILEKTDYETYEIIVLNNQSECTETIAYFDEISEIENIRVIDYDHPFNYSSINNFGVEHAEGSIVGLINNDIEVISPDWLTEMVSQAYRPEVGCVGAKLYYSNNTIQHAGVISGLGGVAGHSHKHFRRSDAGYMNRLNCVQNLSAVTAAVLIVRKDIYHEVGGLEEENLKVAFNDVDFCLKVREAGYLNLWTPYAELYHHESVSRGQDDTPEKKARFEKEFRFMKKKWKEKIESDPFYNPHLTHRREDFSLGL